jgi:orotate phosphoribosyltransferase
MNLFKLGDFTLHSGSKAAWKIDCDALTNGDWAALALMLAERLPPFGQVVGVPRGGLALAAALKRYSKGGLPLVVDDVLTSGASMEEVRRAIKAPFVLGAVVFARGPCPPWVYPLFQMLPPRDV